MAVAEPIPLPWEINPFGMAELVSHEIQIRATVQSKCREARHLVKSDTPLDGKILLVPAHSEIDLFVHELEEKRLAPDKRLIVRLHI